MVISQDHKYIAVVVGKQLIRDEELITELIILNRNPDDEDGDFKILKGIDMVEMQMSDVCKNAHFDKRDP